MHDIVFRYDAQPLARFMDVSPTTQPTVWLYLNYERVVNHSANPRFLTCFSALTSHHAFEIVGRVHEGSIIQMLLIESLSRLNGLTPSLASPQPIWMDVPSAEVPASAGMTLSTWIPACAGMTVPPCIPPFSKGEGCRLTHRKIGVGYDAVAEVGVVAVPAFLDAGAPVEGGGF